MSNVFVGVPSYGKQLAWGAAQAIMVMGHCSRQHKYDVQLSSGSLITYNCNTLWVAALNARAERGFEWFAMLHTDIEPDGLWLDTLIGEAEKYGADMMSAVVPLKTDHGSTSTAIADPRSQFRMFCRLTQAQVRHASFPDTFDVHSAAEALERLPDGLRIESVPRSILLTNTGCFVCRLNRPWAEKIWFEQSDGIEFSNGTWTLFSQPEDWNFARKVAANGGKVMATKRVNVIHHGGLGYRSDKVWGNPIDMAEAPHEQGPLDDRHMQRA